MNDDDVLLQNLTNLFDEFNSSTISNDRRKEIQTIFSNFEQSPNALELAICFLWSANNQYLANYCFGIIETQVQKWTVLSKEDQFKIYISIRKYMIERVETEAIFLIKKASKIFACIAIYNWFDCYEEYINFIKSNLDFSSKKCLISLFCIKSIFEQFGNCTHLINSIHKTELRKLLSDQVDIFCDILIKIIPQICETRLFDFVYSFLDNKIDIKLNSSEFWNPILSFVSTLIFDCLNKNNKKGYIILSYFDCLCELLNFTLIDNANFHKLMVPVFIFSLIGTPQCLSACVGAQEVLALSTGDCGDLKTLCLSTLTCVYDLTERCELNDVYQARILCQIIKSHLSLVTNDVVIDKYYGSFLNETHLTKTTNIDISSMLLIDAHKQTSCHEYEIKLVYIIRSLLPCMMKSLYVNRNTIDTVDFDNLLQLFHKYTFLILNLDVYIVALKAWSYFFESVQFYWNSEKSTDNNFINPFLLEIIFNFGKVLLCRLFYSDSSSFLTTLDDEDLFDDDSSNDETGFNELSPPFSRLIDASKNSHLKNEPCEFAILLRESLMTFQTLVDILPKTSIQFVFDRFVQNRSDFYVLLNSCGLLTSSNFFIPKGLPAHRVHWILRDFATSLQIVGFFFENLCHLDIPFVGRELLKLFMECLHTNASIIKMLNCIQERLIRLSLIDVIVQNLLILRAVLISGCLNCTLTSEQTNSKVYLTFDERDSFVAQLLISIDQISSSSSFKITKCCVQLFKTLFTCPIHDLRPSSSLVFDSIQTNQSAIIFRRFFDMIFQPLDISKNVQFNYGVKSLLINSFVFYLTSDEHVCKFSNKSSNMTNQNLNFTNIKQDWLKQIVSELFVNKLNLNSLQSDPDQHLLYLDLLNDAILVLGDSVQSSRNSFYLILTQSNLMNQLVDCLLFVLKDEKFESNIRFKFCTSYLNFLVTFIRVLSNTTATMSFIPSLLGQIIQTFRGWSNTQIQSNSILSVHILEYLMPMFLFISRHKKIFLPHVMDTMDLYVQTFLPILAYDGLEQTNNDNNSLTNLNLEPIVRLVCLGAIQNGCLMQQFYDMIFSILTNYFSAFFVNKLTNQNCLTQSEIQQCNNFSNGKSIELQNPNIFHQFVRIILIVFDPNQPNTSLVQYVIEHLLNLNKIKRIFNMTDFSQSWLAHLIGLSLNLLLENKHQSSHYFLIELIYHGVLSLPITFSPTPSISSLSNSGLELFVQLYLPKYLNEIHHIEMGKDQDSLLSCFFDVNRNIKINDLKDFTEFNQILQEFIWIVRKYFLIRQN